MTAKILDKDIYNLHKRIATQLQLYLEMNEITNWLTISKSAVIMKVRENENDVRNFSLITCLSLMWKISNGILTDELHDHLQSDTLLTEVQTGRSRKPREASDQLLTDKKTNY